MHDGDVFNGELGFRGKVGEKFYRFFTGQDVFDPAVARHQREASLASFKETKKVFDSPRVAFRIAVF